MSAVRTVVLPVVKAPLVVASVAWRWLLGAIACTSPLLGVLAVGWTFRAMQRVSLRRLGDASAVGWPHWVIGPHWVGLPRALGDNAIVGFKAMVSTWLLTGPACVLWLFSWRYGWDNSFTKGYELAWIGPVTGLLGIVLFVLAMLYLPMAQARQAMVGTMASFWDVGLITRLVRQRWAGAVPIAAGYAFFGFFVMIMWMYPVFRSHTVDFASMTPVELKEWLDGYYFGWALLGFPAFVLLKVAAARWYAGALRSAISNGFVRADELDPVEVEALERAGIAPKEPVQHHLLVRLVAWTGTRAGRFASLAVVAGLYFAVASEVFVANFFNYRPVTSWTNQPLVHVPVFKYVPPGLD